MSSSNSVEGRRSRCNQCGDKGLKFKISNSEKNPLRSYWMCNACKSFVDWVTAEEINRIVEDHKNLSTKLEAIGEDVRRSLKINDEVLKRVNNNRQHDNLSTLFSIAMVFLALLILVFVNSPEKGKMHAFLN